MAEGGSIQVLVEAAGAEQTQEDIEGVEQSVGEAGEEMSDTADDMEGLTNQMKGLGKALAASLAVAAGGLLSQVPVLGEAFGGLKAIAQALGYQMDQLIRTLGAGGLIENMYSVSEAIYELDGAAKSVVGAATALVAVLAPLGALLVKFGSAAAVVTAGTLALAVAVGALIGIIGTLALNELGVLDWFHNAGEATRRWWDDLGGLKGAWEGFIGFFDKHISGFMEMLTVGWDETKEDINGIIDWIVGGFEGMKEDILGFFGDVGDDIAGVVQVGFNTIIPDDISIPSVTLSAPDWAGGMSATIGGQSINLPQLDTGGMIQGTGVAQVHQGEAVLPRSIVEAAEQGFSADRGTEPPVVRMDGRRLTQQDSRYRRNGTAQRGRNG